MMINGFEFIVEDDILNLTSMLATKEQQELCVVDLDDISRSQIREYMTFYEMPDNEEIEKRAWYIVRILNDLCESEDRKIMVLVDCPLWFMETFKKWLISYDFIPMCEVYGIVENEWEFMGFKEV
jgi:hypothetical protein